MIDDFSPEWLGSLDAMSHAANGGDGYLLLDGVFLPDALSIMRRWPRPTKVQQALFHGRPGETDATLAASPWLLPYEPGNQSMHALLDAWRGMPAITFIRTNQPLDALLQRLRRWCAVRCGEMVFNFRYPDTRRLPVIHQVLDDAQHASLFGEDDWSCMARDGQWMHLPGRAVHTKEANDVSGTSGVAELKLMLDPELSDEQFAMLLRDSEPDEVLAALRGDLPLLHDAALRHSEVHQCVQATLHQADRLGWHATPERIAVCHWVMQDAHEIRLTLLRSHQTGAAPMEQDATLHQLDTMLAASHKAP